MQRVMLYRYNRECGGVTVSPIKPAGEYTELYRLIADDGYTLTDGATVCVCVDTDMPELWHEIVDETANEEEV